LAKLLIPIGITEAGKVLYIRGGEMLKKRLTRSEELRNQTGFTLIEMLIVIIVLGILAMIIVPQITVSTDDAKVSTLQSSLAGIRSAIEVYYVQHSQTYPGEKSVAAGTPDATEAATAFVQQLTRYTNAAGSVSDSKSTVYKYGPYIRGGSLPTNPFNTNTTVVADIATTSIAAARAATGATGWKVITQTGVVFANDDDASGGVNHETY
jgi:prepilin-type N-terminal cleavage/methylation domain-containing protein